MPYLYFRSNLNFGNCTSLHVPERGVPAVYCRYAGRTAQIAFPGESHGTTNYVPVKGMNEFAVALNAKLP